MPEITIKRDSLRKYQGEELAGVLFEMVQSASMGENIEPWLAGLPQGQRTLYLLGQFDGAICCDGLYNFFANASGSRIASTLGALKLVDAVPLAHLLKEAMGRLPAESLDREEDQSQTDSLGNLAADTFRDLERQYFSLSNAGKGTWFYVSKYLATHELEFFDR